MRWSRCFVWLIPSLLLLACHSQSYEQYEGANTLLDSTYQANQLERIIEPYRDEVESTMNQKIGFAPEPLVNYAPESPLSNFAADVVFQKGLNLVDDSQIFSAVNNENTIGLLNFGGLRAPINAGAITVGNMFEVMPFDNTIVLVRLNPQEVDQLIVYLKKEGGQPVSNARFDYRGGTPIFYLDNETFKKGESLNVITSNYLASGGDGMNFLRDATQKWDTGVLIRDAFIEHVQQVDTITAPKITGRIKLSP